MRDLNDLAAWCASLIVVGCYGMNFGLNRVEDFEPGKRNWRYARNRAAIRVGDFWHSVVRRHDTEADRASIAPRQRLYMLCYLDFGCLLRGDWRDRKLAEYAYVCGFKEFAKAVYRDLSHSEKMIIAGEIGLSGTAEPVLDEQKVAIESILMRGWVVALMFPRLQDTSQETQQVLVYALAEVGSLAKEAARQLPELPDNEKAVYTRLVRAIDGAVREALARSDGGVSDGKEGPSVLRDALKAATCAYMGETWMEGAFWEHSEDTEMIGLNEGGQPILLRP